MPTLFDRRFSGRWAWLAALALLCAAIGCGGREPSPRQLQNARAFEALLTAVSLKNRAELEADARKLEERYAIGQISARNYGEIREVIARARANDWSAAEDRAYKFRRQFGDQGSYFD